jgi:hypothetical protein
LRLARIPRAPFGVADTSATQTSLWKYESPSRQSESGRPASPISAGEKLLDTLARVGAQDHEWAVGLSVNRRIIEEECPTGPWRTLWRDLASACGHEALVTD